LVDSINRNHGALIWSKRSFADDLERESEVTRLQFRGLDDEAFFRDLPLKLISVARRPDVAEERLRGKRGPRGSLQFAIA
jgi:hypothetical protein